MNKSGLSILKVKVTTLSKNTLCPAKNILFSSKDISDIWYDFNPWLEDVLWYIYNIDVIIEFMWQGLEMGERRASLSIRFVPSHIHSIFTVNMWTYSCS